MPYCDRCDRSFRTLGALNQHEEDSPNHHNCCGIDFPTWSRKEQHWIGSRNHAYCQLCEEHFDDEEERQEHMEDSHHYCKSCRRVFANERGLTEHYRQSEQHHYCLACDRHFQNDNGLRMHLNSSTHRPRNTHCPFGCGESFISNSALVLHLEAGGCSSGVNRNIVNKYVRQHDKKNIITDPSRLITAGFSADEEVTYHATGASWNGWAFECYLCHNDFSTLRALNQHLTSPAHQEKSYICRGPNCGARFVALSALCQHIESEKCGVLKFRVVKDSMDRLLGQMKRLAV